MTGLLTARRIARTAAIGLGALAAGAGAGMVAQARATREDRRRYPPSGELVDIGDRRLHAKIMGDPGRGGPTVVFEGGLACPLETWGWVQPAVAEIAPTISYDRAGVGASPARPGPRTATAVTEDLAQLLAAADLPTPYVLVGHSLGGLLVRHFANAHPDRIGGIVLADATHPDQLNRSTRQWLGLPLMRAHLRSALISSTVGLLRVTERYLASPGIECLPEADRHAARARMLTTTANRTANAELAGWLEHMCAEVRDTGLPAEIPLAVVTAGMVVEADPVHHELQAELSQLTLKGSHRVVDGADHLGLVMNETFAGQLTAVVNDVVSAVR